MPKAKLFKIALTAADMTAEQFAESQRVSGACICRVLYGHSRSKRIEKAIDQFIAEQFCKLKIQYKKAA
ncbi:MAG: hypothetical protein ACE5I1_14380 [bacterium]